jgi:tripartite-type tricarboxylate transporter receptor subunit TctC
VQRLSAEVQKITAMPEMRNQVVGADWTGSTPQAYASFIKGEIDRWSAVIRSAKLQQD